MSGAESVSSRFVRLVSELRRRNVFRMAVLYVVAAWLIMQVAGVLIDLGSLPEWIGPIILPLLVIGFPIALTFSWFYEITPEGISLEKDVDAAESITHVTGRRMDFIVISLLSAGLILFAYDKWWIGPPPEKSIAVLPFENMSGDPDQEYFSDGISEDILNLLAKFPELTVISRSSAFSFKGKNVDIPTIAERLNVAHVLEGSVRRVGSQVRITVQLIDTSSDSHLWSESYDRELDDIFAVQDEIAGVISDALKVKLALTGGETVLPTVVKTANSVAYDAYLQGREFLRRREMEDAVLHLKRSLRLDERSAPAHAHLAIATMLLSGYGESTWEEARKDAVLHLDRAQEVEPDLAEAHGGRALFAAYTGDPESTIEHARKALASNPSYVDAMNWLQMAYLKVGYYEEAVATLEQMLVIDPLSLIGRYNYAESLALRGRPDEARELADQILAQDLQWGYESHTRTSLIYEGKIAEGLFWALKSGGGNAYVVFAFTWVGEYIEARRFSDNNTYWVDLFEGRFDDAIRRTQESMRVDPDNERVSRDAAYVSYYAGRINEALPLLERSLDSVPEGRPISSFESLADTMMLAMARRETGDEEGAQTAAQIVRLDLAARRAAGQRNWFQDLAETMLAAFDNNSEDAIASLRSAIERGLRYRLVFDNPIFDNLRHEPRFIALQQELVAILAAEHDKIRQLICFNNPTPDSWQPLPATCEGVVDSGRFE